MTMRRVSIGFLAALGLAFAPAGATPDQDFQARCQSAGVLRCIGFDQASDVAGGWGSNTGVLAGTVAPTLDATVKASGASALKFVIASQSGAGYSGSYFANFSADNMTQFGENSTFYVQWRQRFSSEFLNTVFTGADGWKQDIIGTGDKPGCSNSNLSLCNSSCSTLEVVNVNTYGRGLAHMYNSCTGSTSHGPYSPLDEPYGQYDFKLQNARPSPYCLYSQRNTSFFPPTGNCFGYFPNEWMTFQVSITTGPRVADEFVNSRIRLWIARDGQPAELVMDRYPYNLSAGSAADNEKYGKVWLLPYNTNKNPAQVHPTGYTWYDELIISTQRIPDPGAGSGPTNPPPPPPNVRVN